MERRYGPPNFAVEHEELLRDPSMTGAEFTLVTVSDPSDDSERVNVTLRYFRSNGAPYEFTATLGLAG